MRIIRLLLIALLLLSLATVASAQATRTWVSGVGDDANPCSRTAPCKTFAGAISKTARDGYINVLDPGGFGTVTITKSITIDGTPFMAGQAAAVTTGIIVNITDVNDIAKTVVIRNLDIEGLGNGLRGINMISANKLLVENTRIFGFRGAPGIGILVNTTVANFKLVVRNCTITGNAAQGIQVTGSAGGAAQVHVDNTVISENGSSGLDLISNAKATVSSSDFTQNGSAGVFVQQATTDADIAYTVLEHNVVGVSVTSGSARLYNSHVTHNSTSVAGTVQSHGNNGVINNTTNTAPALLPAPSLQ
jgi:hypothetical protein